VPVSDKPPAGLREATPTASLKGRQRQRRPAPEQQSFLLAPTEQVHPPPLRTNPVHRLWLCIYLPALALEAVCDVEEAFAVFEERQGIRTILLANAKAAALGVGPELSVNAALALLPTLCFAQRSPQREAEVVHGLAGWAEKFTSFVCIEAPSMLLLEIAGSLKLFGGLKALRQRIVSSLRNQGFSAAIAIAPTPLAASWMARAGRKVCIRDPQSLAGKLAPLPLSCLDWPDAVCASLRGMGVSSVGDCLRLPRQGFAKRFGASRLLQLDRALDRLPDPRTSYRTAERFVAECELDAEQSDSTLLLNACQELLVRLEKFLLTRQMAVQHVQFSFFHLRAQATHLPLGCVQADRAVQHWYDLLSIKFERLDLPEPVIAIQLCADQGQPFSAKTSILPFAGQMTRPQNTSFTQLAERLGAYIGAESIHGVMTVAEHRPQYAWRRRNAVVEVPHCANVPGHQGADLSQLTELQRNNSLMLRRPLWMLREPELLPTRQNRPVYQGTLTLLDGPERLETGWWDDDGIARDYFVARNTRGVHLWVYQNRSREDGGWYLHGIFG
jgi:protein ImuB